MRGYVIGGALYETEDSQYDLEDLRALAGRLGLAGRVGFTGFVDDAAAAMRALDVVVHASTQPGAVWAGDRRSDGLRARGYSRAGAAARPE